MQCTQRYLPLCSIPKSCNRDGWAGENALIYLPFLDYLYFFNGGIPSFPNGTVSQYTGKTLSGITKTGAHNLGCSDCVSC